MTQTNEIKIATLEANMANIAKDISEIKVAITAINVQLNRQPSLEAEVLALKNEIHEIKTSSNLWRWLGPTLTAILTAAVTFLLVNYIQRL